MTPAEWFNTIGTVVSLYLGYIGYKAAQGEIKRLRRSRKVPRLLKERQFIERLHASPSLRTAYLVESALICMAIVGAMFMFSALDAVPPHNATLQAFLRWIGGGAIYLLAMYRLGRYRTSTTRYEKTMERLDAEIKKLEV